VTREGDSQLQVSSLMLDQQLVRTNAGTSIPVRDSGTRMILLTQLVAQLESSDQSNIAPFISAGIPPRLVERLRSLTLVDTVRFATGTFGLCITIDCQALEIQLGQMDRAKQDRSLYEAFVRGGASPRLISRLFGVAHTEVRRLRRLIAPAMAIGGRPKLPEDNLREDIRTAWQNLVASGIGEKECYWRLSQRFPDTSMLALETVVEGLSTGP
jgi:hypothetical protein